MLEYKKQNSIVFVDEEFDCPNTHIFLVSLFVKNDSEVFVKKLTEIFVNMDQTLFFAGAKLTDGWSEFYFYASKSKGVQNKLKNILADFEVYHEMSISKDKKHSFYKNELFPSKTEYALISSKDITKELQKEGIDLKQMFEVEHYADFEIKSQADRFVENAKKFGFEFKDYIDDETLKNGVALVKKHPLDEANLEKEIKILTELVEKEYGEYLLWSVAV